MTTEPKIVERRGKVYVEYDSVGDAFSDVTAYAALRTRLAEAEGLLRQVLEDAEWYYQRSAERTTGSTCLSFEQARAFLEGSQEVSE